MFKSYKKSNRLQYIIAWWLIHAYMYVGTVILSLDLAAFIVIQCRNHYCDANHNFSHIVTALSDGTPL